MESNKATSTKEKKVSTVRGPAQLTDLQGALCVPTYNLTSDYIMNRLGSYGRGESFEGFGGEHDAVKTAEEIIPF